MKKLTGFTLLPIVLLCGCRQSSEPEKLDIVSAVAIDRTQTGYELQLEIADVTTSSDAAPNAKWLGLSGETLPQAFELAPAQRGRKVYFGHTQLVAVGHETAQEGVREIVGTLMRTHGLHLTCTLAVAAQSATDTLKTEQGEAFALSQAVSSGAVRLNAPHMPLYRFLAECEEEGIEGILPRVIAGEDGQPSLYGVALFKQYKMVAELEGERAQTLLLLRSGAYEGIINIGRGESAAAFELRDCDTNITVHNDDESPRVSLTMSLAVEFAQLPDGISLDAAQRKREAEQMVEQEMLTRITDLLMYLQNEINTDALGVGRQIHRTQPKLWRNVGQNWQDAYSKCPIDISVKINVSDRSLRADGRGGADQ